jgi:LmbE family N-acetylglucosaminyl deacetylase
MTILVIAAHPDDEVLGCGGTIARLAQKGHDVYIAILGEGITSRFQEMDQEDQLLIETLHTCTRKVAELLGAKDLFLYNFPDNRFDIVPLLDIVKTIENLIDKIKPEIVYTHHGGDLNIDHKISFRATMTATRPMKGIFVKELYTYEVPSSTEWSFNQFEPNFIPNVFVDISKTLDLKIKAMELYEGEVRPFPHPRSIKALCASAENWGSTVGLEAAEAFQLIRKIHN